jgi:nucleoside-diphosphate-sugar epimerase
VQAGDEEDLMSRGKVVFVPGHRSRTFPSEPTWMRRALRQGRAVEISRTPQEVVKRLKEDEVLAVVLESCDEGEESTGDSAPNVQGAAPLDGRATCLAKFFKRIRPEVQCIVWGSSSDANPPRRQARGGSILSVRGDEGLTALLDTISDGQAPGCPDNVFVTGATGFLMTEWMRRCLTATDVHLWVLARPKNCLSAEQRVLSKIPRHHWERVTVLSGDLGADHDSAEFRDLLGLVSSDDPESFARFEAMLDHANGIVHAGAYLSFEDTEKAKYRLWDTNVAGTERVIALAQRFRRPLRAFDYVSTFFVHGVRAAPDIFREEDAAPPGWLNFYEKSKWAAESLIRSMGLPYRIFRMPILCEDPGSDELSQETIYGILEVLRKARRMFAQKNPGVVPHVRIPGDPDVQNNFIVRSDAVDLMERIRSSSAVFDTAFHVVNPRSTPASLFFDAMADLLEFTYEFVPELPDGELNVMERLFQRLVLPRYGGYLYKDTAHVALDNVEAAIGDTPIEPIVRPFTQDLMTSVLANRFTETQQLADAR